MLSTVPEDVNITPGTAGNQIRLQINFVEWTLKKVVANGYHVTSTPEIESVGVPRKPVDGLKDAIGTSFTSDGDANSTCLTHVKRKLTK